MAIVVIANEDTASLDTISAILSADGHKIFETPTGQEAYEKILEDGADIVFLAVRLAVFNGYETCEMIRNDPDIPSTLPIIFLSSSDIDTRKLDRIGATDTLPQHYLIEELQDLMIKYLGPKAIV